MNHGELMKIMRTIEQFMRAVNVHFDRQDEKIKELELQIAGLESVWMRLERQLPKEKPPLPRAEICTGCDKPLDGNTHPFCYPLDTGS